MHLASLEWKRYNEIIHYSMSHEEFWAADIIISQTVYVPGIS